MLHDALKLVAAEKVLKPATGTKVAADLQEPARAGKLAQQPPAQETQQALRAAAQQIEAYLKSIGRAVEFRFDDDTGKTVITVRDTATNEVIRQIPSDEMLRLARHLDQANALVNVKV